MLVLPFIVVGLLRLYEEVLISHTEEVLISEAVVVGELYRRALLPKEAERPLALPKDPKVERFHPFAPRLHLANDRILPPASRAIARRALTEAEKAIAAQLGPVLQRTLVRNLSGIRVVNKDGLVVASSLSNGYSLAHLPEVEAALDGEYAPALRKRYSDEPAPPLTSLSRAAAVRVSLAVPIYREPRARVSPKSETIGVVYANRTPMNLSKALFIWRRKLYLPVSVSLVITLGLVIALTLSISRPLTRLRERAEAVAAGREVAMPSAGRLAPLEIHALTNSIDEMRGQLESRAEYIREFAANAAHELKTPLTSLRGASELLLEDGESMTQAQRQRFLSNIHSDAVRMDALVGRILQLARIESTRPAREPIELEPFLKATQERYRRREAELVLDYRSARSTIEMAPEQLESLVSNLVDNAVRHGEGRPVRIEVQDGDGALWLRVINEGAQLPEGHLERVFERFYSTERGRGGTGLGLAMVKAIAEAHGGRVEAKPRPEGGAVFSVLLGLG